MTTRTMLIRVLSSTKTFPGTSYPIRMPMLRRSSERVINQSKVLRGMSSSGRAKLKQVIE